MVSLLTNLEISFTAGLISPLVAVCVLPLYPGFLSYLANKASGEDSKRKIINFGLLVVAGVILSMFLIGLIFTGLLQTSLGKVTQILSPIAFGLLAIISILMIFNVDLTRFLPQTHAPVLKNPYFSALLFGIFFGAIVLPCNPAGLAVLFAVSTSVTSFLTNLLNFVVFGIGMGLPLLVLAVLSATSGKVIIDWLTSHKKQINVGAGIFMLLVSLYYLFFVFKIHSLLL